MDTLRKHTARNNVVLFCEKHSKFHILIYEWAIIPKFDWESGIASILPYIKLQFLDYNPYIR